jgi:arginase family enzyme
VPDALHVDLDGAWDADRCPMPVEPCTAWGPPLRFSARRADVAGFARAVPFGRPDLVLYGSGDFHHLSALRVRARLSGPLHVVSFDNHPDWDRRPPRWSCGGWVHRILAEPAVRSVTVWGCGNFELELPWRLLADRRALAARRLVVRPWAQRLRDPTRAPFAPVTGERFRDDFAAFAERLAGRRTYVTVDLDCLRAEEATTNWEPGLFGAQDVAWAVGLLRETTLVAGADLCGAWSPPRYARPTQRLAAAWDHPREPQRRTLEAARRVNHAALDVIWPALSGSA